MVFNKLMGSMALGTLLLAGLQAGGPAAPADKIGDRQGGFIGVEGSAVFDIQSSVDYINGVGYFDDSFSGSGGSFGVRIGAQENDWRVILGYEYFDNDDNQNYERAYVQLDYFILGTDAAVNPYVGLSGGWLGYETDGADANGFAYGGDLGVTLTVSESVDLDFAVRYLFATQDEVDHIGTATVGIHYFY